MKKQNEIRISYDLGDSSIKIMMDEYNGSQLISVLAVALGSAIAKEATPEFLDSVRAHAIKGIDMVLGVRENIEFNPIVEYVDNSVN
jgi:hypothetical protein